ncbi:MAG TPA: hypothetical protein EYP79_00050 [Campylobacterales bacterium]|nr:hypothetical protein [Campylobacterales bacterium]
MDKLRDIKPLVQIPDYSFYAYIIAILLAIFLFLILFYKIIKIFTAKKVDPRKEMINSLKNLDFNNPKKAAYLITKLGRELVHDDRSYKIFEELLRRLQKYKYKKDVPQIEDDVKSYLKLFLETVNE